jgi:hypothetical protein
MDPQITSSSVQLGVDYSYVSPAFFVVEEEVDIDFSVGQDGKVEFTRCTIDELEDMFPKDSFENIWVEGKDLNLQDHTVFHQVCLYVQLKFHGAFLDDRIKKVERTYQGITLRLDQVWRSFQQGRVPLSAFQALLVNVRNLFVEEDKKVGNPEGMSYNIFAVYASQEPWFDAEFTGVLISEWPNNVPPLKQPITHSVVLQVDGNGLFQNMTASDKEQIMRRMYRQEERRQLALQKTARMEKEKAEAELALVQEKTKLALASATAYMQLKNGPEEMEELESDELDSDEVEMMES